MKTVFKALVAVCVRCRQQVVRSAGVIVGDKEWRQVTETIDFNLD